MRLCAVLWRIAEPAIERWNERDFALYVGDWEIRLKEIFDISGFSLKKIKQLKNDRSA